jgi:hypothetical protein
MRSVPLADADSQQGDVDLLNVAPNHKPQSNVDLLGEFAQPASTASFGAGGSGLEDLLHGGQTNNPSQELKNSDLLFDPFGGTSSQV